MIKIVTHNGGAHVDDFLASCILLCNLDDAILCRQPATEEDLNDPNVWVIDQGRQYNSKLNNYDHHHLETEKCAVTMLLDDIAYSITYRELFPEWKFIEQADSRGPFVAGRLFGDGAGKYAEYTRSPIVGALLKRFSKCEGLVVDEALLNIMKGIGESIFEDFWKMEALLMEIGSYHKMLEYGGYSILDVSSSNCPAQLPTKQWSKINNVSPDIILAKNYRGNGGYRMIRTNDSTISFNDKHPSVTFAHITGFLVCFDDRENFKQIIDLSTCYEHKLN